MRWPTTCAPPWCARRLTWQHATAPGQRQNYFPLRPRLSVHVRAIRQAAECLRHSPVNWQGVCWDNAWVESFNATLKNERVHRMVYPTRKKAMNDIASWIELTYNHTRLHSALGYRTPNEVEHELLGYKQSA
nr:integrase core domain-containing protein [Actinomyces trachealis]